ncbi:NHLP leader peptide family RiPP precursor [Chryseobacterium sp. Leaf201]|uniref:NHLP leader peptide family RiPP precursor n=1 Tax=Chryseobacterium sp. Leaf201 TaxID=1735672 RepID=UPI0006FB7AA5|nr:NHLP leader peptide family RiPP precursor [Chryseobacterium sp. Leaf201]KQM19130.1 TOMM propeptide domain-containing protein [Chryseobacterium sp. Leaf201]
MEFTHEQKIYAEIVQKAWEDAAFKKELTADPIATVKKYFGQELKLPEGKTLVVRDQTDESTAYINIPAETKKADDLELSEQQLEAVAGGAHIYPGLTVVLPTIIFTPSPTVPEPPVKNFNI